jgi:ABC-type uncharacterized transport system auxiliary subunit
MVVTAPSPAPPQYRIETRDLLVLQRFDDSESTSEVEVSLRARIIDVTDRTLLGAQEFRATATADPSPQGGVVAANLALAEVMEAMSAYLLELIGS